MADPNHPAGSPPAAADPATGLPRSLLLRIVQCNRVELYGQWRWVPLLGRLLRGKLYFIVFENLFHRLLLQQVAAAQPDGAELRRTLSAAEAAAAERDLDGSLRKYDLKGSWVNRRKQRAGPGLAAAPGGVLQDGDLHEPLFLAAGDRGALLETLERDTAFLAKHRIMDYSLLLGVKLSLMPVEHSGGDEGEPSVGEFRPHMAKSAPGLLHSQSKNLAPGNPMGNPSVIPR
jgi:hypothetical protein